ncbi:calcium-binding protein [Donghicola sp. B5-SW-15]|uniref:Calcium-binding protein n=1 Tax=Donghicola mangrovi TaxID=2729614 RepID=A0A850Q774_9RHOB|nr:calcium-binding protein [Donghicola mangrovi]
MRGNGGNDRLFGDDGSDKLFGNGGRDVLSGGSDADFLSGGGARDRLYGNSEDDRLYGNGGKDRLYGGEGDDSLYGGKGSDKLKGGAGDDTFIFTEAATLRNADKILDFDGDYDRIGLCQNIYGGLPVGALDVSAFASNTDGVAEDAAGRIIYESDLGRLYYDAHGTGSQTRQLIAILSGAPELDASDVYIF